MAQMRDESRSTYSSSCLPWTSSEVDGGAASAALAMSAAGGGTQCAEPRHAHITPRCGQACVLQTTSGVKTPTTVSRRAAERERADG